MNIPRECALILYGVVHRSLRYTAPSIRKYVVDPLQAFGEVKIYFHTWDTTVLNNPRAQEEAIVDPDDVKRYLPEAIGGIDSERHFDEETDWRQLDLQNRTSFRANTHEGRVSFRNILRSLESLERAWQMFSMVEQGTDSLVVATRADLRFGKRLCIRSLNTGSIGIPDFHSWGGLNDRFAVGTRPAMEVYCRRKSFYEQHLGDTRLRNPESVLAAWLAHNSIHVQKLDFPFQRIRADGRVYFRDI